MSRGRAVLVVSWPQPQTMDDSVAKLTRIADAVREHLEDEGSDILVHVAIDGPADAVLRVFDPPREGMNDGG